MKPALLLIAGSLATCVSATVGAASGWTDYGDITEITPTNRHYYTARLSVRDNPSGCRDETGFFQDYGDRGSKQMFFTLLQSLESSLKVRVYVTGRCNLDGYSEISSVSVTR
jgi:hypothetical protein